MLPTQNCPAKSPGQSLNEVIEDHIQSLENPWLDVTYTRRAIQQPIVSKLDLVRMHVQLRRQLAHRGAVLQGC